MSNIFAINDHDQTDERDAREYRELLRKAAKVGGKLFGPVPEGVRREFFCLNEHTWVWHEEWTDEKGEIHVVTTRYDMRPNGILKAQDGQPYRFIEKEEARRLYKAARLYINAIRDELAPR